MTRKAIGAILVPCGTPALKASKDKMSPFNLTAWVLLDKKLQIQGIMHGLTPKLINLRTRMVWLTLSKALGKVRSNQNWWILRLVSTFKNVIHDFHQTMCCGEACSWTKLLGINGVIDVLNNPFHNKILENLSEHASERYWAQLSIFSGWDLGTGTT